VQVPRLHAQRLKKLAFTGSLADSKLRKQQANFIHSTMFMVGGSKFGHELAFKSLSAFSTAKNRQQSKLCLEVNT
jgi:hypothetical protein